MDLFTLQKANALNDKMRQCAEALDCFQWKTNDEMYYSKNPILYVEHDDEEGDRTKTRLPFSLTGELIDLLRNHIKNEAAELEKEFNEL